MARSHGGDGLTTPSELKNVVEKLAAEHGFARVGICDATPTAYREEVVQWIAKGAHGTMSYLESRLDERVDPSVYVEGALSIICVADRYSDGKRDRVWHGEGPRGRIARYARGRDYHKVMKKRLLKIAKHLGDIEPAATFRVAVDTAPLLEREHAARAGLGLVGKNTLLIEPGIGSWMLLGAIVTTAKIQPTTSSFLRSDPCGSCTRCIDACPTQAIEPFQVDATRCIAYTSIEHRGVIDETMARATGDWIFGCDICQEVCPHSARPKRGEGPPVHEAYDSDRGDIDLLEILGWDEEARMKALLGTAAKRASLAMWKRNAIICAANIIRDEPKNPAAVELQRRLEELATDSSEEEIVRLQAAQSLNAE